MKSFQSPPPPATPRPSLVLLVRHGRTDALATQLCGRMPGVRLNADGQTEAQDVAAALARLPIVTVYTSPLTRGLETAAPIASTLGVPIVVEDALNEVDFGAWTGTGFAGLADSPAWRVYNTHRAGAGIPGGESPVHTQARIVGLLQRWSRLHPGAVVAAVTHAEIIRYAVLASTRTSIDQWHTINVPTASITTIRTTHRRLHLVEAPARAASCAHLAWG